MKHRPTLLLALAALLPGSALADGARYLIITPDSYEDELQPLADWKTQKGMLARIVTTRDTGYSTYEIISYIQEAAETWDPAPEYVLIVSDLNTIPMASEGGYNTDTSYGNLDDDLFVEIIPGRFPAADRSQAETMVAKTLQYERTPALEDEYFYRSSALLIYEDHDDDDICSYFGDAYWEAGLMQCKGWDDVRIMSYSTTPNVYYEFQNLLNAGLGWAVHHGVVGGNCDWPGYGVDPAGLDNGPMLPIVVGFTCQTLGYAGYDCYGERWLQAGSPSHPVGATAYVGQAASCSYCAHWRSAMRRGFFGYVFEDNDDTDIITFGEAVEAARLRYYDEFHSTSQYLAGTAYGDPELNLWTDLPQAVELSAPPVVPRGSTSFSVLITQQGEPRQGALVCIMSEEGSYAWEYTDSDGVASFDIDTSADLELSLTVTGRDLQPVESEIAVYEGGSPVDTRQTPVVDTGDSGPEQEQPPDAIPLGGVCGCGGGALSASPLAFLLLPLTILRRRRETRDQGVS